jgi:hypothetical protein
MNVQLPSQHVLPAGTNLQSENHGQHQKLPANPGLAPAPAEATTHTTQPQYGHSMPVPAPIDYSEIASQSSYGQQPMQMNAQLPPQHVNPAGTNLQSENHGQHQQLPANPGLAPAPAEATTHTTQPQYGHSMPVPVPMNMQQTSSTAGQYELSSVSYGHSQPQQVQMPSQQTAAPEAQSQVPASFAVGQMQMPAPAVGQGVQVQAGGHQVGGGHVMQQQQPVPLQSHQVNVPQQQPTYVAPQPGQNQAYANSAAPPTPTQSAQPQPFQVPMLPIPMHQQPPPMQQAQQIPQSQQLVYAVGHSSQVESTGGPPQPSQAQDFQESMQATSNPQQATADEDEETSQDEQVNGVLEVPAMDRVGLSSNSEEMDEERAEELRMLDEEFSKTVIRAKKVFDSRMDNITRLQHEREAQHQKTLSEHEKRRADFEKRLQQEEIEQNRRIVQLQEEWERKREEVRRIQEIEALAENALGPSPPADENMIPVSNESGNEGNLSE